MPDITSFSKIFENASRADWTKTATKENDGKNPDETLGWKIGTLEGGAYYDKTDRPERSVQLSPSQNPYFGPRAWHNLPVVTVKGEKTANQTALSHLKNGADGILFDIRTSTTCNIAELLEMIDWPYCMIGLIVNEPCVAVLNKIPAFIQEKGWKAETLTGFILWERDVQQLTTDFSALSQFKINGVFVPDSSDVIEQISNALSVALKTKGGVAISLPIGTDFFIELVKLKALRAIWSENSTQEIFIHTRSNPWISESFNPHSNMLKAQRLRWLRLPEVVMR